MAFANPDTHVMVAPHCLLETSHIQFNPLATTKKLSLISIQENQIEKLIDAKHALKKPCGGFIDVTHAWNKKNIAANKFLESFEYKKPTPSHQTYHIQYENEVNQLISHINPMYMWTRLSDLTNYPDRYANSKTGLKAAVDIRDEMIRLASSTGHSEEVSVYFVPTGNFYKQPSVVMKYGTSDEPGVVIGGHMDTLSSKLSLKPGADDDGSGSVTVLETAHTILSSGMHFKKPLYFVWYSAEEMGLVGSQFVVEDFMKKSIPVSEVIQFDMTGYRHQNNPTMWLVNDYVNSDLTTFVETLIKTYVKVPVDYTQCGYACSDHATWTLNGFASSMPFEASFGNDNPDIHTSRDTIEKLSLEHMINFATLGVAFAVELAEPVH
jgi:leucyl aminopeptidase